MNREVLLRQLQELQADFEDFSDEDLIDCRDVMLERVNICLIELGESDEDNLCVYDGLKDIENKSI